MREPSVLLAAALLAACAHAAPAPTTTIDPPRAADARAAARNARDVVTWPGATDDDLRLAAEILALTRRSLARLMPDAAPLDDVPVRVVVSDGPQPVGSAYLLALREVRIERRYVSRLNLAHEATHALLHGRTGIALPTWFDEAVAQLVAYDVVHGAPLPPPSGRPVSDFAKLRALRGDAWRAAGPFAYAELARWLGYLLPDGPAPDADKAALRRFAARLFVDRDAAKAESEIEGVR